MEDDSLLDDPTIIVRETSPQTSVTPGSFSMKLVSRLGLNRIRRSETVSNNNKSNNLATNLKICVILYTGGNHQDAWFS